MSYDVEILPQALSQIAVTYRWLNENIDAPYASKWYDELQSKVASLQQFHNRCPIALEAREFQQQIRQLLVGKGQQQYRVLFVVENNQVSIIYVRHSNRPFLTEEDED